MFLGQHHNSYADWQAEPNGTYVYIGNIKPIKTKGVLAVVDPQIPAWVKDKTNEYLPKLFDFYVGKTGQALDFRPIVFFNYENLEQDTANYSGGTLAGIVQLTIRGNRWQEKSNKEFEKLIEFLAHESAHFWNGQMFRNTEHKNTWLQEGGADAFAYFALRELGIISTQEMLRKFEDAANACIINKGPLALELSIKNGSFQNYYSCGATMAFASAKAISKTNSDKTLFDLWGTLFKNKKTTRLYTKSDYFTALRSYDVDDRFIDLLDNFSSKQTSSNLESISRWFTWTNIDTIKSSNYSDATKQYWGRMAIAELMKMHCHSYSLNQQHNAIKTAGISDCKAFAQTMYIRYLDGLDLSIDGITAYNRLRKICQNSGKVVLQNRSKNTIGVITCTAAISAVNPSIEFTSSKQQILDQKAVK